MNAQAQLHDAQLQRDMAVCRRAGIEQQPADIIDKLNAMEGAERQEMCELIECMIERRGRCDMENRALAKALEQAKGGEL